MINIIKWIRNRIYESVTYFFRNFILTNRTWYYDRFYGTDNVWILIIKNLLEPRRFLSKVLYGRVFHFPIILTKATSVSKEDGLVDRHEVEEYVEKLRNDGIVFLNGHFKEGAARAVEYFKVYKENYKPAPHYWRRFINPSVDPKIYDIFINPLVLSIISYYSRSQPFFRCLPCLTVAYPTIGASEANTIDYKAFALSWHYDTVNLVDTHFFLENISTAQTRMLYARGSHKVHRACFGNDGYKDFYYSDQYVKDHYEIIDCCGEAGTIFIADPNGLHKAELVKNSFRAEFIMSYSPGNSLLELKKFVRDNTFDTDSGVTADMRFPVNGLSEMQRRAVEKISFS